MKWVSVEETTWPIDDDGQTEWVQRYGDPVRLLDQRLAVASVMSAYRHLTDPRIPQSAAIEALKRARKARSTAAVYTETEKT